MGAFTSIKEHSERHPGFKAVAAKIGQEPGIRNPGAVLAAVTRRASPDAKRRNPALNKVKMPKGS